MRRLFLSIVAAGIVLVSCSQKFDVCVYGGSASGIMAAYSAAQMGMKVVLIEPSERFGGLTAGGLGYTDIGNKQVVKGLSLQFYRRLGAHYGNLENWVFEPSAAAMVLDEYLSHPNITAVKGYHLVDACKDGTQIRSIRVSRGNDTLSVKSPWFIDSTYEGDLMAAAGVEYRVGREDNSEYGETWNGVHMMYLHQFPDGVDPFVEPGNPESGLLWGISTQELCPEGSGDTLVQAYNYRICLTDSLENMIPIVKPENYDSSRYELLVRLYNAQPDMREITQYFIWCPMPNRKTDVNNRGAFSADMIGMNYDYPESSWERRQEIIKAHRDYTLGLLYFTAHDKRIPAEIREYVAGWGLPKDEYEESEHWTPQLYVRESRRMVGEYVATQADCEGTRIAPDGIAMAAYTMDSHNCQRIVIQKDGKYMVKNEGDVEISGGLPYPISFRSLTPKREQCTNLLVPVCCSASHIAYGSIRMEPVFMCMGQAAGLAVSFAKNKGLRSVQDVDYRDIVKVLETDPFQNGTSPDVVMDDASMESVPGWQKGPMKGTYGPACFTGEKGSSPVVFSAVIPSGGEYLVYSYQHKPQDGINPVTLIELSTGDKFTVNAADVHITGQTTSAWHLLGNVSLNEGDTFSASFSSDGGDGKVIADAVLLVKKD